MLPPLEIFTEDTASEVIYDFPEFSQVWAISLHYSPQRYLLPVYKRLHEVGSLVIVAGGNMKISSRNSGAKPVAMGDRFIFHLGKCYVFKGLG